MPKKKPEKTSVSPTPNFPAHYPENLLIQAEAMPWKTKIRLFEVEAYSDAISKLFDRGYSYAEITDWLNERLADKLGERKIKRGQVYRVYQQLKESRDPLKETLSVTHIDDEDAEKKAELSDKKSKKEKETEKEN